MCPLFRGLTLIIIVLYRSYLIISLFLHICNPSSRGKQTLHTISSSASSSASISEPLEIGVQTKDTNIRDQDKEEFLELLKELVVIPRKHLDTVMALIKQELAKPDVNYSWMLKLVHEYTAIEVSLLHVALQSDQVLIRNTVVFIAEIYA